MAFMFHKKKKKTIKQIFNDLQNDKQTFDTKTHINIMLF